MLVIDPDECIDCTLCVAECPVEAIFAEDDVPDDQKDYTAINAGLAALGQEAGILIVDVHSVLATPDGGLRGDYAADDGLHLTVSGEQAIADAVYRALHPAGLPRTD